MTDKIDFDTWASNAVQADLHPYVLGFLQYCKRYLHGEIDRNRYSLGFDVSEWTALSDFIYGCADTTTRSLHAYMAPRFEPEIATTFCVGVDEATNGQLPNISDILRGEETTLERGLSPALQYVVLFTLLRSLRANNDTPEGQAQIEHVLAYVMRNFPPELNILFIRHALATLRLTVRNHQGGAFEKFAENFRSLILA